MLPRVTHIARHRILRLLGAGTVRWAPWAYVLVLVVCGGGLLATKTRGSVGAAFVGLLVVAVRPARARTMLPVAFVVASALAVTAVFDAAEGRVTFIAEGRHIPELVSLALVWLLTRANVAAGAVAAHTTVPLRLVDHDISPDRREVG